MLTIPIHVPEHTLTLDYMESFITAEGRYLAAQYNGIKLHSHFQPIYSLAHQRIVGFEALVRPSRADGNPLSPLALFASTHHLEETVFLDRLCRTLHIRNFVQHADDSSWLFLNINPLVTVYGQQYGAFFQQLLQRYGISPHRVVIEILEGQIHDEDQLAESIRYYRDMGCLIAIDDFGVGHSNFNRIWRTAPHIVKLDKSLIDQAVANSSVRRVLPGLVSLIHQAGSLALIEGIETEQQALIALRSDIDFVQGYFFAQPGRNLPEFPFLPVIGNLFAALRHDDQLDTEAGQIRMAPYKSSFFEATVQIRAGMAPLQAVQSFLALPGVLHCYLLDELGRQVDSNLLSSTPSASDPRFAPLYDANNAIWARRHYYQRALAEPGRIQISKPYLSMTGGTMCTTLSIAISTVDGLRILCGDMTLTGNLAPEPP